MVTLAYRTQGLILAAGNPKGIKQIADIARNDVKFVNRNPGSGTRLWLDENLKRLGIPPVSIRGYEHSVHTHSDSARAIQSGVADVTLGIQAAAHACNLGFIPLFEERYDLVLPIEQEPLLAPLLNDVVSASFRREIESLTGYDTTHSGEQIHP
jgi:putative molybdopterin biosynthesis protein